jgi:hypothetical protein
MNAEKPPKEMHPQLLTAIHNKAVTAAAGLGIAEPEIAHFMLGAALHAYRAMHGDAALAIIVRDFVAHMQASTAPVPDPDTAERISAAKILGDRVSEGLAVVRLITDRAVREFEIDLSQLEAFGRAIVERVEVITAKAEGEDPANTKH